MSEGVGLVLVIERDPGVAELERRYLVRAGFDVEIETDPGRAAGAIGRFRPDAVVLDLSRPAGAPGDLYRTVAEAAGTAPIVCVVTAGQAGRPADPGDPENLENPADLAVPGVMRLSRPFGPRVLVAAVAEALRRRGQRGEPGVLRAGAVSLDPRTRSVGVADGKPVTLTATEFDLLEFLMGHPGRVFTREQLLEAAWDPGASAGSRTIDVHIAQLRAKLGAASPIRTVRGVGYAVDP